MTRLDRKPKKRSFDRENLADDEIEIIEIVGLDDDPPARPPAPEREDRDSGEIILDLDADTAGPADLDPDVKGAEESPSQEQLLRLHADFENFKSRVDRERESTRQQASAVLVSRLLPVLDNFERAVSTPPSDVSHTTFHHGVSLIFRQILEELRKEGLVAIDTVGEPFNPELHEAVATDTESDFPPHTVVEELQRGYLLHDRLLRPSLVRVRVEPTEGDAAGCAEET